MFVFCFDTELFVEESCVLSIEEENVFFLSQN
jgi:hypothetical protein